MIGRKRSGRGLRSTPLPPTPPLPKMTGLSLLLLRVPRWRNGRRRGLKILRGQPRAGSSPALGTNTPRDLPISLVVHSRQPFADAGGKIGGVAGGFGLVGDVAAGPELRKWHAGVDLSAFVEEF